MSRFQPLNSGGNLVHSNVPQPDQKSSSDRPPLADWQLPRGVSRSLWEFAQARHIAREEAEHLAGSPLLELDRQVVERWLTPPGRIADLGCGTGRLALPLAERGFEVVGVDLSRESLQVAAERAAASKVQVSLVEANLCDLACLQPESFDAALLMFATLGMVSGSDNRAEVLRQAQRLLKPGSTLILHVHSIWSQKIAPAGRRWLIKDLLRRLVAHPSAGDTYRDYRGIPGMYHHLFTRRELQALLRGSGFYATEVIPVSPDWLPAGWLVRASQS